MSGYTPLFSSLTTGTLCGKWPDIGLWPIVLSLSDKHGVVDVTPAYIAGVTGLALADVAACMKRFCEPDPYSRSGAESGARLVLVDEHRDWGWRVVNHGSYREKARKQMQQNRATESGRDADRKRIERESKESSDVRLCPAVSSSVRPSYSDADTNKNENTWDQLRERYPPGTFRATAWLNAERDFGRLVDAGLATPEQLIAAVDSYRNQQDALGKTGTAYVLSPAKFFANNEWRGPFPLPPTKKASEWM